MNKEDCFDNVQCNIGYNDNRFSSNKAGKVNFGEKGEEEVVLTPSIYPIICHILDMASGSTDLLTPGQRKAGMTQVQ